MMKFVVKVFDGNTMKQIKQKTFKAEDWGKAETIGYRIYKETETKHDDICDYSVTYIPQ